MDKAKAERALSWGVRGLGAVMRSGAAYGAARYLREPIDPVSDRFFSEIMTSCYPHAKAYSATSARFLFDPAWDIARFSDVKQLDLATWTAAHMGRIVTQDADEAVAFGAGVNDLTYDHPFFQQRFWHKALDTLPRDVLLGLWEKSAIESLRSAKTHVTQMFWGVADDPEKMLLRLPLFAKAFDIDLSAFDGVAGRTGNGDTAMFYFKEGTYSSIGYVAMNPERTSLDDQVCSLLGTRDQPRMGVAAKIENFFCCLWENPTKDQIAEAILGDRWLAFLAAQEKETTLAEAVWGCCPQRHPFKRRLPSALTKEVA